MCNTVCIDLVIYYLILIYSAMGLIWDITGCLWLVAFSDFLALMVSEVEDYILKCAIQSYFLSNRTCLVLCFQ